MRIFTTLPIILLLLAFTGCGCIFDRKTDAASFELKVIKWGPESTKVGLNPNAQPDGSMGIWIEVATTENLGEAEVLFSGRPAKTTSVQPRLVTAAIPVEELNSPGQWEIAVKQTSTGKIFPVGTFTISAN